METRSFNRGKFLVEPHASEFAELSIDHAGMDFVQSYLQGDRTIPYRETDKVFFIDAIPGRVALKVFPDLKREDTPFATDRGAYIHYLFQMVARLTCLTVSLRNQFTISTTSALAFSNSVKANARGMMASGEILESSAGPDKKVKVELRNQNSLLLVDGVMGVSIRDFPGAQLGFEFAAPKLV